MDASATVVAEAGTKRKVKRRRKRGRAWWGCVWERRPGVWAIRIKRNGTTYSEVVGPDKALAEARLSEIQRATMREHALGVKEIARVTWGDFQPRLLSWLKANHKPTTYAGEVGRVAVVGAYLGARVLCDVTKGDVEAFLAYCRNELGHGIAAGNRYRALLSVAFRIAVEAGFARSSPMEGVRWAREQAPPVPYLEPETIDRILARADPAFRPFLTLAADSGCRRSELLALAWSDVDLAGPRLTVRRGKTGARTVPLTPRALGALRALHETRGPAPMTGAALVFADVADLDPSAASKAWARAAKAAGIPGLRLHDARHGYASALARAGTAPGVIGALLGDKTPSVVYRYSRHAPKGAEVEAVERLAEARGQATKPARKAPKKAG